MTTASSTAAAREKVRRLMPIEGDIGFRRRCETVLEFLDPQLGELVLDCGCGYGFTLHVLQALTGARLVGLDLGLDRLRAARERLGGRIAYVRGSAMDLPFADGTFYKIVSSEVLEHLPDDRLAISEMARVLKPGGTLAITVPCADYPAGWDPFNWGLERAFGRHIGG
ncbi:MAG: class I SAM-dependent methyltransferase, partial [Thermomicrobiales bacterium]